MHPALNSILRRIRRGFTIVEVMVVVVIIGILAGIAVAHFGDVRERTYVAAMKNDLNNYAKEQAVYQSQTTRFANDPTNMAGVYHYTADVSTYRAIGGPTRWWLVVKHAKTTTRCRWGFGDIPDRYRPMVCGQVDVPATAEFTYSPTNPAPGANVAFDATLSQQDSPAAPLSYNWDFGDGATGSAATASHPYAADGDYTVRLVVTDTLGQADTTSQIVHVGAGGSSGGSGFIAAFSMSPASPQQGDNVLFTSASTPLPGHTIASYQWDMGNGLVDNISPATDCCGWFDANGAGIYNYGGWTPGTYTVALTLTDDGGTQATVSHQLVVTPMDFVANLSVTPLNQLAAPGATITVDASGSTDTRHLGTTYEFDIYGWDPTTFNTVMDTAIIGTQKTYVVNTPTAAEYDVSLTLTDTIGRTSYASGVGYVLGPATVGFVYAPHPILPDSGVNFTQTSTNLVSSSWDFGDGTTSTDPAPMHAFSAPGTYTVTLTGVDGGGQQITTQRPVPVGPPAGHAPPTAIFVTGTQGSGGSSADGTTGTTTFQTVAYPSSCGPARSTVNFDASMSKAVGGYIVGYHWDFGDGIGVSNRVSDGYAWSVPGTYLVTLTVEDVYGATAMSQQAITIVSCNPTDPTFKPMAWIQLTPRTVPQGGSFTATAQAVDGGTGVGVNIASYQWNLGDLGGAQSGQTANGTVASNAALGGHTITVTVTDMAGSTGDASAVVTVTDPGALPVAKITQSTFTASSGQAVTFDGSTSTTAAGSSIVSYTWDLGDGDALQTLSTPQIQNTYGWADIFIIRLTVTDSRGLSSWRATYVAVDGATSPSNGECIPSAGCVTSGPDGY